MPAQVGQRPVVEPLARRPGDFAKILRPERAERQHAAFAPKPRCSPGDEAGQVVEPLDGRRAGNKVVSSSVERESFAVARLEPYLVFLRQVVAALGHQVVDDPLGLRKEPHEVPGQESRAGSDLDSVPHCLGSFDKPFEPFGKPPCDGPLYHSQCVVCLQVAAEPPLQQVFVVFHRIIRAHSAGSPNG